MYKSLLSDENGTETEYARACRLEYCYFKLEDIYDEKTMEDFVKYCQEKVNKGEFLAKKAPSIHTIYNKWFHRWNWKQSAKDYAKDFLDECDFITMYEKSNIKHLPQLIRERADALEEITYLRNNAFFETEDEKERAVNRAVKTLKEIEFMLRLILRLSTSNPNVDANMEAKVESVPGAENIFSYSSEEMERIQNIGNDNEDFLDKL